MVNLPDTSTDVSSFTTHHKVAATVAFVPVIVSVQRPAENTLDLYDLNKRLRGNRSPLPGETDMPDAGETAAG